MRRGVAREGREDVEIEGAVVVAVLLDVSAAAAGTEELSSVCCESGAELFGLVVSAQGSSIVTKGGCVQTDWSKNLRKCLAAQLDLWLQV